MHEIDCQETRQNIERCENELRILREDNGLDDKGEG